MRLSFVRAFAALAALLSIRGVPLAAQLVPIHPDDVVGKTPAEVLVVPEVHSMYGSGVFTWRNSVLGGAAAAALLVGSVVAYLMMWTLGVGPVGSLVTQGILELVTQGILEKGNGVLPAEFENRTDHAALGAAVTGAVIGRPE